MNEQSSKRHFRLRCVPCDVVVRFGDGSAVEHVAHGIAVEWFDGPQAEVQRPLFPEAAA
jgi:hypothetical protein